MSTVGQQGGRIFPVGLGIGATQLGWLVISLRRAAGMLPMSTVPEPMVIIPGPAGTHAGSMQGTVVSVTRAAGRLPMRTLG